MKYVVMFVVLTFMFLCSVFAETYEKVGTKLQVTQEVVHSYDLKDLILLKDSLERDIARKQSEIVQLQEQVKSIDDKITAATDLGIRGE